MNRRTLVLAIILCLLALPCLAATTYRYVDSSVGASGDGTVGTPWKLLSDIKWTTGTNNIKTDIDAGNPVIVSLKRGDTWRETMTVGYSGTSSAPITIDAYGTGAKPVIKASDLFAVPFGTDEGGGIYSTAAASQVYLVWRNGTFLTKATSVALTDGEWFWASSKLYMKGDQAGNTIEGAIRASCITAVSRAYLNINNVRMMHTNTVGNGSRAINISTAGDNIHVADCEFVEACAIYAANLTNASFSRCLFGQTRYTDNIYLTGACDAVAFRYSLFTDNRYKGITIANTSTGVSIANCAFDRFWGAPIYNTSSGTHSASNIIIAGGAAQSTGGAVIQSTAGTFTLDHSIILPDGRNPTNANLLVGVTEGAGNIYDQPRWARSANEGIITFNIDDTGGVDQWNNFTVLADEYGYRVGLAIVTSQLNAGFISTIQGGINRGHWIASHTRNHAVLTVTNALNIQYVGAGATCTMRINSSTKRLTTTVDGSGDLDIDLTAAAYDTQNELCVYINGLADYTCTQTTPASYSNASVRMVSPEGVLILGDAATERDVDIDIRSAVYNLKYDPDAFYNEEVTLSKSDLESTFTAAGGGPYPVKSMLYAYGNYNATSLAKTVAAGYLGARATDSFTNNNWMMGTTAGINIYRLVVTDAMYGAVFKLDFENNANDSSANANHFTASNASYSNTVVKNLLYSAVLNGTTSYFYKSSGVGAGTMFDLSRGDISLSSWIRPTAMTNTQTLYYHGTDAENYHRLYIDTNGAIHYEIWASGTKTVSVDSANGVVAADATWRRVHLKVYNNTYVLYCDTSPHCPTVVATTVSANKPVAYTGTAYVGCGYDWNASAPDNFFQGYLDWFVVTNGVYFRTMASLQDLASNGGIVCFFHHLDNNPLPVMRVVFDACRDFTGRIRVMPLDDALEYIRSVGAAQADGQTWIYSQANDADYHLRPESRGIYSGADLSITGGDYSGAPLRDSAHPGMGPYEAWPKIF
jgi:hypothetical protein